MTRISHYLFRMALFLTVVGAVAAALHEGLVHAFMANPGLNGLILGALLTGILLNIRQVLLLKPEVAWLESWRKGQPQLSGGSLRLLAPMAGMLGDERRERMTLSAMGLRSLLDSIAARLDESRELARYFVGLLIFLGLLGTFWGLSRTVGSVGDVIRSLTVGTDINGPAAFEALKAGLEQPLSGMGTAFSTSLFGLSGSLVLGFLDLQAGQAQNSFYNELEDWLSGLTRVGAASGGMAAEMDGQPVPAYIQALLEQTADSLDSLQRTIARGEEGRGAANTNLRQLTEKLSALTDHMRTEQALMLKLAENQIEMKPLLSKLTDAAAGGSMDEASRAHIRSMDVALARLVEETIASREEVVAELRHEFKLLARTIAAVAEDMPES